ncbi:M3 family oligoendopeptidase [Bacillus sp. AK031]
MNKKTLVRVLFINTLHCRNNAEKSLEAERHMDNSAFIITFVTLMLQSNLLLELDEFSIYLRYTVLRGNFYIILEGLKVEKTISEKWDLESIYSGGSQSQELHEYIKWLNNKINELRARMSSIQTSDTYNESNLVFLLEEIQQVMEGTIHVDEYLICVTSDNVEDQSAADLVNQSTKLRGEFEILLVELDQVLLALPQDTWKALLENEQVNEYAFFLEERRQRAQDKLPLQMEKLIQTLSVNGFNGWESHFGQLASQIRVPIERDGEMQNVTVGEALYEVLQSPDPARKKTIIDAYNKSCKEKSDTFAAILNHVSGFRLDIYAQREWDNPLKELLDQNRIGQSSLNSMMAAIKSKQPALRRFLKRKAELMKVDKINWYDIPANTFTAQKQYSYEEARKIIIDQLNDFSKEMGQLAEKAFDDGWIEAENRPNKRAGAFCASFPLSKESRILTTYRGSYLDIITLAHELGHAYHNSILDHQPPFAREKGTSLAETASTFCENLVLDAAMQTATDDKEKLSLLESKIVSGLTYLGLLPTYFNFEQNLYEKRKQGMLSAEQITGLMAAEEADIYGDAVDYYHSYSWVTTSHFYSTEKPFYNIPYTIGYLFSNGVYALSKEHGSEFNAQYNELLMNSGSMTVEQLAQKYLNQDLTQEDFWQEAIKPVTDAMEEYINLTEDLI